MVSTSICKQSEGSQGASKRTFMGEVVDQRQTSAFKVEAHSISPKLKDSFMAFLAKKLVFETVQ